MKILGREKGQFVQEDMGNDEWELIGFQGNSGKNTESVPNWVLKAYKRFNAHANGLVHYFDGKRYRYKVEEHGRGGTEHTFYRKLKQRRDSQPRESLQSNSE